MITLSFICERITSTHCSLLCLCLCLFVLVLFVFVGCCVCPASVSHLCSPRFSVTNSITKEKKTPQNQPKSTKSTKINQINQNNSISIQTIHFGRTHLVCCVCSFIVVVF